MLKLKTKPTTDPTAPDFEAARERYEKASAEYDRKRQAIENIQAALYVSKTADGDQGSIAPMVRQRAQAAYPKGLPRRSKIIRQAEDVTDALEDATPGFDVERELYQAAARRETGRIAQKLQPAHRKAVRGIATALESLSRALEAEGNTRAELAREAPEATSAYLPDCSSYLSFGSLVPWNSPASQWAREMRKLGILD